MFEQYIPRASEKQAATWHYFVDGNPDHEDHMNSCGMLQVGSVLGVRKDGVTYFWDLLDTEFWQSYGEVVCGRKPAFTLDREGRFSPEDSAIINGNDSDGPNSDNHINQKIAALEAAAVAAFEAVEAAQAELEQSKYDLDTMRTFWGTAYELAEEGSPKMDSADRLLAQAESRVEAAEQALDAAEQAHEAAVAAVEAYAVQISEYIKMDPFDLGFAAGTGDETAKVIGGYMKLSETKLMLKTILYGDDLAIAVGMAK